MSIFWTSPLSLRSKRTRSCGLSLVSLCSFCTDPKLRPILMSCSPEKNCCTRIVQHQVLCTTFLNRSSLTSWVWTLKVQGKRWNSSGLSHPRRVSQSWGSKIFKRNKGVSPPPGLQLCPAWGTSYGRDGASLPRQPPSRSPRSPSYGPGGTMPRLCWTPENKFS